ncbi:MAG: AzlD domain-containing protein [Gammaproteobacteria bacterium]|nr:AzlD domain-containing protein [Gammaproteobacteria bacterium]
MTALIAIAVVGLGTYLSRAVFILALANRRIPGAVLVPLQFVAPAVLSALVVALLINDDGSVAIGVPELSAFIVGAAVAWGTRNHVYTLIAGMGVFWIIRALV